MASVVTPRPARAPSSASVLPRVPPCSVLRRSSKVRSVTTASVDGAAMSMKSSTPARRAESMAAGSADTPVASTGSVGQSRFRRWWSWLAVAPWSGEKSMKTATGPSRAMRSSIDFVSGGRTTTEPRVPSASVSHVMWPPLVDAKR